MGLVDHDPASRAAPCRRRAVSQALPLGERGGRPRARRASAAGRRSRPRPRAGTARKSQPVPARASSRRRRARPATRTRRAAGTAPAAGASAPTRRRDRDGRRLAGGAAGASGSVLMAFRSRAPPPTRASRSENAPSRPSPPTIVTRVPTPDPRGRGRPCRGSTRATQPSVQFCPRPPSPWISMRPADPRPARDLARAAAPRRSARGRRRSGSRAGARGSSGSARGPSSSRSR